MKTVTTLCATGTVGAAAVGLSFGHADKNFTTSQDQLTPRHIPKSNTPDQFRLLSEHSSSSIRPPTSTPNFTSRTPLSSHGIEAKSWSRRDGPPSSYRMRPTTADVIQSRTQETTPHRPVPKRFASTVFSHDSGSISSDQPISRSITYSSASGTPFLTPRPASASLPPNKLVKRSLSQQLPNSSAHNSSTGKRISLKRPITSRQRSATLSQPNAERGEYKGEMQEIFSEASADDLRSKTYHHCFRANTFQSTLSTSSRRKSSGEVSGIKCIRPIGLRPTLLFASSIVHRDIEHAVLIKETLEETPISLKRKISIEPSKQSFSSPLPDFRKVDGSHIEGSQRSFSLSDMLRRHTSPSSKLSRTNSKLRRRVDKRVTSAPPLNMNPVEPGTGESAVVTSQQDQDIIPSPPLSRPSPPHGSSPLDYSPLQARQTKYRRTRNSTLSSNATISHRGSDIGNRVFSYADEDDTDFASDTVYDSVRTGTTRSNSGVQRMGLETLFDKSTSSVGQYSGDHAVSKDDISNYASAPSTPKRGQFIEAQSQSQSDTPLAKAANQSKRSHADYDEMEDLEYATKDTIDDEWSDPDFWGEEDAQAQSKSMSMTARGNIVSAQPQNKSSPILHDNETKTNLFDWSEQQPVDRTSADTTPPRPKTVHGKKRLDSRGPLSTGRRAPSGLHARSHSVPVLPDLASKRTHAAHKFGTWGIGSKGVTEDWNEDFEFADDENGFGEAKDSTRSMEMDAKPPIFVPESIRKQQTNVLANIGLLKEWGLLIEELKELRMRAVTIGLSIENHVKVFDEVDAMIDLADQEAEQTPCSQSSPSYSTNGFRDDDADTFPNFVNGPPVQSSHSVSNDAESTPTHSAKNFTTETPGTVRQSPPSITRPRKDSEAIAKSVVEACQQRKVPGDKVPFDTATLRHIVPYVNNLMHRIKQILRDAEGLNTSPRTKTQADPALRQAFIEPESPSTLRDLRRRASPELPGTHYGQVTGQDVASHLKMMKLV